MSLREYFMPVLAVLATSGLLSCAPPDLTRITPLAGDDVTVLHPVITSPGAERSVRRLKRLLPEAEWVDRTQLESAFAKCLAQQRILVLPEPAVFPISERDRLREYLARGGRALFVGRDPFVERVLPVDGSWLGRADQLERLADGARKAPGLSDVQVWSLNNDAGRVGGRVRIARDPDLPWPGAEVEVNALQVWEYLSARDIPPETLRADEDVLVFYARGGARTTQLTMLIEDVDGRHWFHVVRLEPRWKLHAIRREEFTPADSAGETGAPLLRLDRARHMAVGLDNRYAVQAPGAHRFGISDMHFARDFRSADEALGVPGIALLDPDQRYAVRAAQSRDLQSDRRLRTAGVRFSSPVPRPQAPGGPASSRARWIPLYRLTDRDGDERGTAASLYIRPSDEGEALARWGWLGANAGDLRRAALQDMMGDLLDGLRRSRFLIQAGFDRYLYESGESFMVTARWTGEPMGVPLRVNAELVDSSGRIVRRAVSAPYTDDRGTASHPVDIPLGVAPRVQDGEERFVLRIALEEMGGAGRVFDRVEQTIKVASASAARGDAADWLRVSGPRITMGRIPIFLSGVHYEPFVYDGAGERARGVARWLDADLFAPDRIRRDLQSMRVSGINAVALDYRGAAQAPHLRFVVGEIRDRGLWALIRYRPDGGPASLFDDASRDYFSAHLEEDPAVFAMDVGEVLQRYAFSDMAALGEAWTAWQTERSVDVAPLPLHETYVRDELAPEEEVRYRRFADEYVSRRLGYLVRTLRSIGYRQLLCVLLDPGGDDWTDPESGVWLPVSQAAVAIHADVIALRGETLFGDEDRFLDRGFAAIHARAVSDAKPVIWLQAGAPVLDTPTDLEEQRRAVRLFHDLLFRTHTAGGFVHTFSPSVRGRDYGQVNPDGAWRPVRDVYRHTANRLREPRALPSEWARREFDPYAHRGRYADLRQTWQDVYRGDIVSGRIEELRPAGFGKSSADPDVRARLNAEWGSMTLDGQPVKRAPGDAIRCAAGQTLRLELINTGPSIWVASRSGGDGAVWLVADRAEGRAQQLPLPQTPYGRRAQVSWTPTEPGVWTLRPQAQGGGSFGERLRVEVLPRE